MAKKKQMDIVIDDTNIDQMIESGFVKITTPENTVEAKVLHFREKGYNNNQIAALLNIQKSLVDGIK